MDESPKQLIEQTKAPIAMQPGQEQRQDYEYKRKGMCNIFMANEPLTGKRITEVTQKKTKQDWAKFIKKVIDNSYSDVEKVTLIMDNYGTHTNGAFYETFAPQEAKRLMDKIEFVFTPKHGSWLNMAEIELNVLQGQSLKYRIGEFETLEKKVAAWTAYRNQEQIKINWQFTTKDARRKLKRLYPSIKF